MEERRSSSNNVCGEKGDAICEIGRVREEYV